jgi:hypothetical protein
VEKDAVMKVVVIAGVDGFLKELSVANSLYRTLRIRMDDYTRHLAENVLNEGKIVIILIVLEKTRLINAIGHVSTSESCPKGTRQYGKTVISMIIAHCVFAESF